MAATWFMDDLEEKSVKLSILELRSSGKPVKYDRRKHKRRNSIKIRFGRIK